MVWCRELTSVRATSGCGGARRQGCHLQGHRRGLREASEQGPERRPQRSEPGSLAGALSKSMRRLGELPTGRHSGWQPNKAACPGPFPALSHVRHSDSDS
eukprot:911077-Rhodomonas_salina.1